MSKPGVTVEGMKSDEISPMKYGLALAATLRRQPIQNLYYRPDGACPVAGAQNSVRSGGG
jgi:hypothetical protein